jgi:predicted 3-demethylubiquinone-9 3-methyltransferase (glyoxalase superfamily)
MAEQKIFPHLWFDDEAAEAAEFYTNAFGSDSRITDRVVLIDTPSGDAETITFELLGQKFMAISAGPLFKFNPAISFFVNFDPSLDDAAKENLEALWTKLSDGGSALMELGEYPFSKYYGWVKDKYGLTWQLILTDPEGEPRPNIVPSLLFTGENTGKAAEAADFYLSVFKNSQKGIVSSYQAGQAANPKAKTAYADFMIEGYWIAAMDSGVEQDFEFNEAVSLIVNCQDQAEIDHYWEKLSAVPEAEQCGWLKDKYGVSWQIQPAEMEELMNKGTREQVDRITQAFLPMKKLDIAELRKAYEGTK